VRRRGREDGGRMGKRGVGRGLERVRGVGCRESSHGIIAFILQYEEREREGCGSKTFFNFFFYQHYDYVPRVSDVKREGV
jgi:hypothetical protein